MLVVGARTTVFAYFLLKDCTRNILRTRIGRKDIGIICLDVQHQSIPVCIIHNSIENIDSFLVPIQRGKLKNQHTMDKTILISIQLGCLILSWGAYWYN